MFNNLLKGIVAASAVKLLDKFTSYYARDVAGSNKSKEAGRL